MEPEYSLITGAFVPTRESSEVHEGSYMSVLFNKLLLLLLLLCLWMLLL